METEYLYPGKIQNLIPEILINACRRSDPAAQKELYLLTRQRMFVLVSRYVRDFHSAEDVMMEAYVKLFRNFDKYRGDGVVEAWMRRIFVNECLMFLRKDRDILIEPLTVLPEDEDFTLPDEFDYEVILNLVDKLPEGCRTVFKMYVFDDLQHKEIAEILKISLSTSKSQYQLARKKLIQLIKDRGINFGE